MRYDLMKLPKNSFFEYIFKIRNIIKFSSVEKVAPLKAKFMICNWICENHPFGYTIFGNKF